MKKLLTVAALGLVCASGMAQEAEKKEGLKQRKMLVDNMRVQLGAGLGTSSVMGTKFKKSTATAAPTSTLG